MTNGLKIKFINFVRITCGRCWKALTANGSSIKLNTWPGASGSMSTHKNNLTSQFRMILSIILNWKKREASSLKLQAVDNLKKDVDYIG